MARRFDGRWWARSAWWVYGGAGAFLCAVYFAFPKGALGQSLLYDVIGMSAVAVTILGTRLHRPMRAAPWWLFAVGTFLASGADSLWTAHDAFVGGDPPFPWVADWPYLASYLFLAAGVLHLAKLRRPGGDREAFLDGLMVTVGAGAAAWVFLMDPYVRDATLGRFATLVAIAYPAMDLLLFGIAVRFLAAGGFRRPALSCLLAGIVLLVFGDVIYVWEVIAGTYQSGNRIDVFWTLSYVAFGVAALHPSMRDASRPILEQRSERLSYRRLAILGVVAISGPAVLAVRQANGAHREAVVLFIASIALFILALLRIGMLAVRLNWSLDQRVRAEAGREASDERFRDAFTHAPIGMALVGEDGRWRQVNDALCDMLGYTEDELLAITWMAVTHPDDLAGPGLQPVLGDGDHESQQVERRFLRKDGRVVWAVQGISHASDHAIWQLQDVTARRHLEAELRRLALHDPLTGLPNRSLFADRLQHALNDARRGDPIGVLFLDLDRFKVINDSLGHAAGDSLLRGAADRLSGVLRAGDTLARFGGDEFVALLIGLGEPEEATDVAQRLLAAMHAPFDLDGQEAAVRVSIGIAVGWPGRSQADDLLRHADQALYRAKATGRATYAIFNPGLGDEASRRSALETDLRRAVERGELALRYQPLVDLSDGRVAGAEALVRWAHPTRGLIAPSEFIDLAEESGLIVPLGAFVLEEACRQAAAWRRKFPDAPPIVMGVNLSGRQVRDPELAGTVARVLKLTGLPPEALRLELTEQVLVDNSPATAATLMALKALGVALAIDDFGTGYSSLGSLRHLPVEGLKIDRSFVTGVGVDPSAGAIIEAFVALARALDLAVTAEGIETPEELERVRAAGCEIGQGFLFGPAVTPEAFEMHLAVGSVACPYRVPSNDQHDGVLTPVSRRAPKREEFGA